jgi:hypothetical protein
MWKLPEGLPLWSMSKCYPDPIDDYFITHVHMLKPLTLLMLAVGVFFSYRLALGRDSTPGPD